MEVLFSQEGRTEKTEELGSFMENMLEEFGYTSGGKTFFFHAALEWLAQNGYLVLRPDGDTVTPAGKAIGLLAFSPGKNCVSKILCGKPVQTLLRNNLERLFAFEYTQWEPLLRVLTPDWHKCTTCLSEPVPFTKLLKHINSQLPPDLPRKLNVHYVFNWLAWKGLTETFYEGSSRKSAPTKEGIQLGLTMEDRRVIHWTTQAQQFFLDNLDGVVHDVASGEAFRRERPKRMIGSAAALAHMEYAAQPRSIYNLGLTINQAIVAAGMNYRLPHNLILQWLYREGFCKTVAVEGMCAKSWRPTMKGQAIGLSVNDDGYIVANEAGQRYIAKHLEEIWDLYIELGDTYIPSI